MTGTPTFFVNGRNAEATAWPALKSKLDQALKAAKGRHHLSGDHHIMNAPLRIALLSSLGALALAGCGSGASDP